MDTNNNSKKISYVDNGNCTSIDFSNNVKVGTTLEIKLKGNPSTGFSWYLEYDKLSILNPLNIKEKEFKGRNLKFTEDYEQNPTSIPGMVGVGGVLTFLFLVEKEGKEEFNIVYKRYFEENVEPFKTIKVTVNCS